MRVRSLRRHVDLPAPEVLARIGANIQAPRLFFGALGAFYGRVQGRTFWFRWNAGRRVDGAMTLRGTVTPSTGGSDVEASISTLPYGRATAGLAVILVVLAALNAPGALEGPAALLFFSAGFGGVLDLIWHWHHPCDVLIGHLDASLGTSDTGHAQGRSPS